MVTPHGESRLRMRADARHGILDHDFAALKDGSERLALDQKTRWRLEDAFERGKVRAQALGWSLSPRQVNAGLRAGDDRSLMLSLIT